MSCVIKVENLSKKYLLSHQKREPYVALRDVLANKFKNIFRKRVKPVSSTEEFWALHDVSFDVKQGDRVGIIGRNGAGKSTLLKILSRIVDPTSGRVKIKGRVASLLEVGTGFHPELTGRENIFLNGAILGMGRVEIKRKFDEIVAFSEVEKFLDTPVKHFSSGMYVRLAFAVAAHLEPEILIVDEVLAVGDAAFQKKCLGKMRDVAGEGRTVIFVTHDMSAAETLCRRALLLDRGKVVLDNDAPKVIAEYLKDTGYSKQNNLESTDIARRGNGLARFTRIDLTDMSGKPIHAMIEGEPFKIHLRLQINADDLPIKVITPTFVDQRGRDILTAIHYDSLDFDKLQRGVYEFTIDINPNPFVRGIIGVRLACFGPDYLEYDHVHYAFSFVVGQNINSKDMPLQRPGLVNFPFIWHMERN